MVENKHRTGFAALVGRPNVGKSTLMNGMIGEKISIMSDRPQTTRNKIMGILSDNQAQIMFLDTPGIHKPKNKLGEYMVSVVNESMEDTDAAILVVNNSDDAAEIPLEIKGADFAGAEVKLLDQEHSFTVTPETGLNA